MTLQRYENLAKWLFAIGAAFLVPQIIASGFSWKLAEWIFFLISTPSILASALCWLLATRAMEKERGK